MEFKFNVNEVLKSPIVEINHTLIPPGFNGDRRALWDSVSKISEIVNAMGGSSAVAQGLNKPITTSDRLRNSDQTIYLLVDKNAKSGKGVVTGMLKTGKKSLYVFDREGEHFKVSPPCILDFYVHESRQRTGLGKQLFEYMLQKEQVDPVKLAIDRPSEKLLSFLGKHYRLNNALKQMNNYVVFDGFFPESLNAQQIEETSSSESPCKAKQSANGLQNFPSPYGRYGAPRPTCSMGQIIHNQTSVQSNEPSGENDGVYQASLAYDTSQIATPQQESYRNESQPNICPSNTNASYNQQQQLTSNSQMQPNVMQQVLNSNPNIMLQNNMQLPQQSHNLSQHIQSNEKIQEYSQLPSQSIMDTQQSLNNYQQQVPTQQYLQQHEAYSNLQIPQSLGGQYQDQSSINNAYQSYSNAQNQPVTNVQSQPGHIAESQHYTNAQSQQYTNNQSQLDKHVQFQASTNTLDQSQTQNQPSPNIQNQFYTDPQSQHNINPQNQPFQNTNNQYYTNVPNQSYTNISSQFQTNSQSQPYTNIQNEPSINQIQQNLYQNPQESQHLNVAPILQTQVEEFQSRKRLNAEKYRNRKVNNGLSPTRTPSAESVPIKLCDRGYPDLYRDKLMETQKQVRSTISQQQQQSQYVPSQHQFESQYVPSQLQLQSQYVPSQPVMQHTPSQHQLQSQYVPSQPVLQHTSSQQQQTVISQHAPSQHQQSVISQHAPSQQQIQLQHPTSQVIPQQSQPCHSQINVPSRIQHPQQSFASQNVIPQNQIANTEQQRAIPQFIPQQQSVPQLQINEQNTASSPQTVSWKENVQPNKSISFVPNPQYIQPPNSEQPLCNHQTNIIPAQNKPQQYQYYDSTNQTLKYEVNEPFNAISNSKNVHQSYIASGDMIETQKPIQNFSTPRNTGDIAPSSVRLRTPRSQVHTPRCGLTQDELMPPIFLPTLNQDQSGQMSPHISVQPQSQHMSGELQQTPYESANQSPKLERPRSLSIQCNEDSENVDNLVLQNVKNEVHFEPALNSNNVEIADAIKKLEIIDNNTELNCANQPTDEDVEDGDETDRSKSPNPLTAQGFVDLKFYHSRLW